MADDEPPVSGLGWTAVGALLVGAQAVLLGLIFGCVWAAGGDPTKANDVSAAALVYVGTALGVTAIYSWLAERRFARCFNAKMAMAHTESQGRIAEARKAEREATMRRDAMQAQRDYCRGMLTPDAWAKIETNYNEHEWRSGSTDPLTAGQG